MTFFLEVLVCPRYLTTSQQSSETPFLSVFKKVKSKEIEAGCLRAQGLPKALPLRECIAAAVQPPVRSDLLAPSATAIEE